ncbi:unnamed protein product [Notodromas monacha]|uniref:xanthine dehydrogenase n=1 Tax=Notodromas monacha TaxID=399045 RepID=A0A7R9BGS8_9CRUS|nr:unnamed protein product [Notodromas monacha]CAG0915180.1 unnamed protein product [Notodromas monacha]
MAWRIAALPGSGAYCRSRLEVGCSEPPSQADNNIVYFTMRDKRSVSEVIDDNEHTLVFFVNGFKIVDADFDPSWTLIEYLRQKLHLSGTKYGCGEGGCGACTVMVSKYSLDSKKVSHLSVNACLTPLPWVHGHAITTVEGIGSTKTKMHAVQERLAKSHGSQCGFCTPGFVMSMYTLLRNKPLPTMDDIEEYFQGNLCRCTGYRAILEGYQTFTNDDVKNGINGGGCGGCSNGGGCCKNKGTANGSVANGEKVENGFASESNGTNMLVDVSKFVPYDPTQEPIFPPELEMNADALQGRSVSFHGKTLSWYRPVTLAEILELKEKFPEAKIIGGNTEVGKYNFSWRPFQQRLEVRQKGNEYPVLISSEAIKELHVLQVVVLDDGSRAVRIGAAATLSKLEDYLRTIVAQNKEYETSTFKTILEMLEWFAGKQIRNVAALGGNIVTSSPISDLNPILMAGQAKVFLSSLQQGNRLDSCLELSEGFFLGYRKNALKPTDVLIHIDIPMTKKDDFITGYKQARRRDDDIAIVNAGLRVTFENSESESEAVVKEACFAFGGMAERSVRAYKTESAIIGRKWTEATLELACDKLAEDLPVAFGAPGGKEKYRRTLALSFLYKFWTAVRDQLLHRSPEDVSRKITLQRELDLSAIEPYRRGKFSASQVWQMVPDGQPARDPVGRPLVVQSAFQQCTGEAKFLDDMPKFSEQLYMYPVLSTRAKAKIVSIDTSEAMKLDGVVGIVTEEDVPSKKNVWGIFDDDQIFFTHEQCTGEAKFLDDMPKFSEQLYMYPVLSTRAKAKIVSIDTSEAMKLDGVVGIVTEEDVPSKKNVWGIFDDDQIFFTHEVSAQGQVIAAMVATDRETARIAARKVRVSYEDIGEAIVSMEEAVEHNSFFTDEEVSNGDVESVFATASHVVEGRVRVGGQEHFYLECQGAFVIPKNEHGEMEIFATNQDPSALQGYVAKATGVSSSRILIRVKRLGGGFGGKETRNNSLTIPAAVAAAKMSGQRHGFLGVYKLAADSNGKLLGLDLNLFSNAGYSQDLSPFVMEKSMLDCTNAYEIPVVRVRGRVCRTNLPSNTAFRGFGAMQSMMICEQFMSHMADELGIHQTTFREMNLKAEGCKLFYGQVLTNVTLERCWKEVLENSQFNERFSACEKFNRENKWRKRAISIIPETYGISFTASFMNQGGALVHIYKDGSVLVTHGGVEMGQGLHTKMIQVASRALKIPPKYIHTSEVGTDKVPNTTSTAASFSTDLNGPAVQQACETILNRMEPYIRENPKGNWEGWVKAAYMDCVSLSSTGYYCSPKVLGLFELKDPEKKGPSNVYHSFGAAVSEVEVDCLTGDHKVLRTDIVFDVGDSINPAVDVGQIEGGFIQGYGYWMLEDLEFGPEGQIRTLGPSTYKIPSSRDIPEVFNVALLKGAPNPHAIYSSKAVGEPPLFLSASIFFAVREAIAEYRKQNGITAHFQLDSPATSERIRMLCQDTFTEKVEKTQPTADPKAKPWIVPV